MQFKALTSKEKEKGIVSIALAWRVRVSHDTIITYEAWLGLKSATRGRKEGRKEKALRSYKWMNHIMLSIYTLFLTA
jgi:hypothetical protein